MPSLTELERWMEEQIPDTLHSLPMRVHATLQAYSAQMLDQLMELTPTLSQVESSLSFIPFVNTQQQQAPPPPPPPSSVTIQAARSFSRLHMALIEPCAARLDLITGSRKRTSFVTGIALVGLTYTLVNRTIREQSKKSQVEAKIRIPRIRNGTRCDAVVVLGADTPLGQPLSHALAAQGFIVMASVANEQSKQTFDSLVPPSMRGYIKTIILPPIETQTEHITQFTRTINAARQLRWPLTAAGDPYARKGSEVDIVAVVNALSYKSPLDEGINAPSGSKSTSSQLPSSASNLDVDRLSSELQARVVTPLAAMRALVPLLNGISADVQDAGNRPLVNPSIIVSLAHPAGGSDVCSQALNSGMQAIMHDSDLNGNSYLGKRRYAGRMSASRSKRSFTAITLEAQPSSVKNLFTSLVPHALGGSAVSTVPWSRSVGDSLIAAWQDAPWYSLPTQIGTSTQQSSATRPRRSSSVSGELRVARTEEHRTLVQATLKLLIGASVRPHVGRARYYVRLPAICSPQLTNDPSASNAATSNSQEDVARSSTDFESTMLVRALHSLSTPFLLVGRTFAGFVSVLLPYNPASCYYGTRNTSNSRPAYGPGPGPASNTHSRSCIRQYDASSTPYNEQRQRGNGKGATTSGGAASSSRRRARPTSVASTGSSDHARSSESEQARDSGSARSTQGPALSGPPSNPDMSSSGILSSVPSSAFGDASEEEHLGESDYVAGTDSPIAEGGASSGTFRTDDWHNYSSSELSSNSTNLPSAAHTMSLDDQDDSGTALGARNEVSSSNVDETLSTDDTPHASRFGDQGGLPYGFPSHESMQTQEERPWMGPQHATSLSSSSSGGGGVETPLGQSWVALGQSSTQGGSGSERST